MYDGKVHSAVFSIRDARVSPRLAAQIRIGEHCPCTLCKGRSHEKPEVFIVDASFNDTCKRCCLIPVRILHDDVNKGVELCLLDARGVFDFFRSVSEDSLASIFDKGNGSRLEFLSCEELETVCTVVDLDPANEYSPITCDAKIAGQAMVVAGLPRTHDYALFYLLSKFVHLVDRKAYTQDAFDDSSAFDPVRVLFAEFERHISGAPVPMESDEESNSSAEENKGDAMQVDSQIAVPPRPAVLKMPPPPQRPRPSASKSVEKAPAAAPAQNAAEKTWYQAELKQILVNQGDEAFFPNSAENVVYVLRRVNRAMPTLQLVLLEYRFRDGRWREQTNLPFVQASWYSLDKLVEGTGKGDVEARMLCKGYVKKSKTWTKISNFPLVGRLSGLELCQPVRDMSWADKMKGAWLDDCEAAWPSDGSKQAAEVRDLHKQATGARTNTTSSSSSSSSSSSQSSASSNAKKKMVVRDAATEDDDEEYGRRGQAKNTRKAPVSRKRKAAESDDAAAPPAKPKADARDLYKRAMPASSSSSGSVRSVPSKKKMVILDEVEDEDDSNFSDEEDAPKSQTRKSEKRKAPEQEDACRETQDVE